MTKRAKHFLTSENIVRCPIRRTRESTKKLLRFCEARQTPINSKETEDLRLMNPVWFSHTSDKTSEKHQAEPQELLLIWQHHTLKD